MSNLLARISKETELKEKEMKKEACGFFLKLAFVALFTIVPFGASAATAPVKLKTTPAPLEISGWIPWWRTATGTLDAIAHIDSFSELSPFGFTVKNDGTLSDQMHIDSAPWQLLMGIAREKKVKIIPTVTWSDGNVIDAILRSPKRRKAHIDEIVKVMNQYGFDGIDIDYEAKKAGTKNYFSQFLKELYKATGDKLVVCTIEARTPLDSRFSKIPKDISYANDFVAINKYCDRVRIMAYDQGSIDLKLNDAAPGAYLPVADPKWVEKTVSLAAKTISKKKISIGVATYGYESEVTPLSEGYAYDILWSFGPNYALNLAKELGIIPWRNIAGEMNFMYIPTTTAPALPQTENTSQSNNIAPATTSVEISISATTTKNVPFRMMWWSDASAIRDKVLLAKKLGVRGIAIFKIDGGEDPAIWDAIK